MKTISSHAGTKQYTNHCLRATSISTLQNAGFRDREIMSVSGHHSESSLKHYAMTTSETKENMSRAIAAAVDPKSAPSTFTGGAVDPKSAPSTSTGTGGTASERSESQEICELNEILNEISNNAEIIPVNINASSHVSSQQVQAPIFNIQNCIVHVYNK